MADDIPRNSLKDATDALTEGDVFAALSALGADVADDTSSKPAMEIKEENNTSVIFVDNIDDLPDEEALLKDMIDDIGKAPPALLPKLPSAADIWLQNYRPDPNKPVNLSSFSDIGRSIHRGGFSDDYERYEPVSRSRYGYDSRGYSSSNGQYTNGAKSNNAKHDNAKYLPPHQRNAYDGIGTGRQKFEYVDADDGVDDFDISEIVDNLTDKIDTLLDSSKGTDRTVEDVLERIIVMDDEVKSSLDDANKSIAHCVTGINQCVLGNNLTVTKLSELFETVSSLTETLNVIKKAMVELKESVDDLKAKKI